MKLKWLWGGLAVAFVIAGLVGSIVGAMEYNDDARICRDPSMEAYFDAVNSSRDGCLADARFTSEVQTAATYAAVFTIGVLLTAVVVSLNRPRAVEQQPVRRRAPKKSMAPLENRKAS